MKTIVLAVWSLLLSAPLRAAPPAIDGEWVVAAYLGGARTQRSDLTISQPTLGTQLRFDGVRFRGQSFTGPLYYGVRGGRFFARAPALGVEVEFTHLKVFSDAQQTVPARGTHTGEPIDGPVRLGDIVQRYSISHGLNLLLLNVAARYRPADRLYLTGRFGVGPTIPHPESHIDTNVSEHYQWGRAAAQFAAGAEFRVGHGVYALGEYKFTRTHQRDRIFRGTAEALFYSHHGIFGLSYHF